MKYYSTNNPKHIVSLKEAVFKGLAPDRGLYMPQYIPQLPRVFIEKLNTLSHGEIATTVSSALFGEDIPADDLQQITLESLNFPVPLVQVGENIFSLELYHGPTMAFKDVGARFMARTLAYLTKNHDSEIHILVATSGDTGSAVANGFLGVDGIKVHILYPKGLVSTLQERQFTTLNQNITALEVEGTFDDCQRLVKEAFTDKDINNKLSLSSANSINLARLLPQSIYYFFAVSQLKNTSEAPVICVPSGNFGNITAGLIAKRMGLPVKKFIAATNINDIFPQYLTTGNYNPRPSVSTIANAMDVGDPSNFVRILELYNKSLDSLKIDVEGFSYTDNELSEGINHLYKSAGYLPDPHGAAGYLGLMDHMKSNPSDRGIFLETAHPAKFHETVEAITGDQLEIPERLKKFLSMEKKVIPMSSHFNDFKEYLQGLS
jgi:threonine synthase